jgi:hypothetical protein
MTGLTGTLKSLVMDELKTVAKFGDPMLASISKGLLEANGIKAEIFGAYSSYPSFNAVEQDIELKVNAEDYESALSILAASDKAE